MEPSSSSTTDINRRIARMRKPLNVEEPEINDQSIPNINGIKSLNGNNLKALFRPPLELIFKGDWDMVRLRFIFLF